MRSGEVLEIGGDGAFDVDAVSEKASEVDPQASGACSHVAAAFVGRREAEIFTDLSPW
jgi:hypothetical protein